MTETPMASRLAALAARYWQFECEEFPLTALQAGEPSDTTVLFRESSVDYGRRYREAGDLLAEVNRLVPADLAPQDRATQRLLRHELESIRSFHDVLAHLRPALYPAGPDFATITFANSTAVPDAHAAERYVERLSSVPAFIKDLEENLRQGSRLGIHYPKLVLDRAVTAVQISLGGSVEESPWFGPFKRSANAHADGVRRAGDRTRALIERELRPALAAYIGFLHGELAPGARSTVSCTDAPLGREFYELQVRHFTTTDLTPDAIHQLGLDEVARLSAQIEAVAASAGFPGDVPRYRQYLSTDSQFVAASREVLCEKFESLAKRIDKRIPAFFGRIPRITYGVECMSAASSSSMPPAYAQPNPADRSSPGILWITGLPDRCPTYLHLPLALHEGWPGHLLHVALMQEMEGLPAFRRHGALKYTACVEGWALHCEGLGVEMGLYETPHQHYGRLNMEIWRAARLVTDTGIHWHGWDRSRAVDYMAQHVTLARPTLEAEVDRYIALPGQALAYQIGNLKFGSLRRHAETVLGARFRHRAYYDALMAAGPATLPVLEELMDDWLARQPLA